MKNFLKGKFYLPVQCSKTEILTLHSEYKTCARRQNYSSVTIFIDCVYAINKKKKCSILPSQHVKKPRYV